jgi:uncharacterized repeat protein (TIGR01451 family)
MLRSLHLLLAGLLVLSGLVAVSADPTVKVVGVPARALVYDPVSRKLFATVGSNGPGGQANSVTTIDPVSGAVERSDFIGSDPAEIILSDESKYLYVNLGGGVRRYSIASQAAGLRFPVGEGLAVDALLAFPGDPDTVVAMTYDTRAGRADSGTFAYTNGTPRPAWLRAGRQHAPGIAASRFYGYETDTSEFPLRAIRLAPDGARGLWQANGLISGGVIRTLGSNGLVYVGRDFPNAALDPEAREYLGAYPMTADTTISLPSPERGVVFALRPGALDVFDMRTFSKRGEIPLPGMPGGRFLIPCGDDRLAYTSGESVVIIHGGLGAVRPGVDLSLHREILDGEPSRGGEISYRLKMQNQSRADCSEASLTDLLPRGAEVLEVSASQGDAFASGGIVRGQLGALPAGETAVVDVRVRLDPQQGVTFSGVVRPFETELQGEDNLSLYDVRLYAPTGLKAVLTSDDTATLDWEDGNDTEQGFRVERSENGGSFAPLPVRPVDTHLVDQGLQVRTSYAYRVVAFGEAGDSLPSPISSVRTSMSPPDNVQAAPVPERGVRITWSDANEGVTGYRIERARGQGEFAPLPDPLGADTREFVDLSTSGNTTYRYRVVALSEGTESPRSLIAEALTVPEPIQDLTADTPNDGSPPRGRHEVELTWTDPNVPACPSRIERSQRSGEWVPVASDLAAGTTAYTDRGLSSGTGYTYRVFAVNASGDSLASAVVSATTKGGIPAAPANLRARAISPTTLRLRWEDRSLDETGFRITRTAGRDLRTFVLPADRTRLDDRELDPNTLYRYELVAFSEDGSSPPVAIAARTPGSGELEVGGVVSFGSVEVGRKRTRQLVLRNRSKSEPLSVRITAPKAPFQVSRRPREAVIGAGKSLSLKIRFAPARRGSASRSLTIRSSDDRNSVVTVRLVGMGT